MAADQRKFEDLLKEAPKAPEDNTVSLVGTLAQHKEPSKFVLTMAGGNTVTLDVSAVKDHAVLGSSVGQPVVRIDVDRGSMPAGPAGASIWGVGTEITADPGTVAAADAVFSDPDFDNPHTFASHDFSLPHLDLPHTVAYRDHLDLPHTVAYFDQQTVTYLDHPQTVFYFDHPLTTAFLDNPVGTLLADQGQNTIQETVTIPTTGVDPAAQVAPFSLALQHQAPQAMLSVLKAHADPKTHADIPKVRYDPKVPHYDSAPGYYPDY